jgi:hypothetical protein
MAVPPLAVPRSQESGNIVAGSAVYYLFIYIGRDAVVGLAVVGIRGAGSSM